mmetsp:Transcript_34931/g.91408  ORF Transcript_34931/g.91408 Transcript_34931/m.91408 type:complete len:261 (-) Transcript_34931:688-1470(-)
MVGPDIRNCGAARTPIAALGAALADGLQLILRRNGLLPDTALLLRRPVCLRTQQLLPLQPPHTFSSSLGFLPLDLTLCCRSNSCISLMLQLRMSVFKLAPPTFTLLSSGLELTLLSLLLLHGAKMGALTTFHSPAAQPDHKHVEHQILRYPIHDLGKLRASHHLRNRPVHYSHPRCKNPAPPRLHRHHNQHDSHSHYQAQGHDQIGLGFKSVARSVHPHCKPVVVGGLIARTENQGVDNHHTLTQRWRQATQRRQRHEQE